MVEMMVVELVELMVVLMDNMMAGLTVVVTGEKSVDPLVYA